jgi:hypothetical protein
MWWQVTNLTCPQEAEGLNGLVRVVGGTIGFSFAWISYRHFFITCPLMVGLASPSFAS